MNVLHRAWTVLRQSLAVNPAMRYALWWQLALLTFSLAALPLDHRRILGLDPWIKPLKFEISVIIYLLTVTVMLYALRWHRSEEEGAGLPRARRRLSLGFAAAMTVENTIIALQSFRGVRSHMNYTSALNGLLFAIMGNFILLNTVLVAALLLLWCMVRVRTPAPVTWGVRLGLLALLLGSAEGALIVHHGAHTVGAVDGLPGLPFLNWSRQHGDLRVAHFFALHALQIFPLFGLLVARTQLQRAGQVLAVCLFAGAYLGGVWWLFAAAMHGRPLLSY